MLGIEPKAVRVTWSVLLTVGCFALLYTARRIVLVFLLAIFFAYLLSPVVTVVDRFVSGRVSRTLSLAIVYVLLIAVLVSAAVAVGTRASEEAANLVNRLPELATKVGKVSRAPLPDWLEPVRGKVFGLLQEQLESGLERALPMLSAAIGQLLAALGNLGFALLVPLLSFFFLKDAAQLRATLLDIGGRIERPQFFEGLLDDIHAMLGQYIRALFLLSMATFIAYALFFQITGAPYAALLATIAAVLEFVPVLGPLAAGIIACVVSLISGYAHVGWMIVFFLLYRVFQDYLLQPFLLSSGVALHPLLIVFGALAGEQVAGIAGMVFSAPVLAALRLIYVRATRRRQ
ncbi:MAG: AI-2E family transporter [Acidobacteria bacterium]|nr:AI-2E family transporter [Acidobacteriota bacterium]